MYKKIIKALSLVYRSLSGVKLITAKVSSTTVIAVTMINSMNVKALFILKKDAI